MDCVTTISLGLPSWMNCPGWVVRQCLSELASHPTLWVCLMRQEMCSNGKYNTDLKLFICKGNIIAIFWMACKGKHLWRDPHGLDAGHIQISCTHETEVDEPGHTYSPHSTKIESQTPVSYVPLIVSTQTHTSTSFPKSLTFRSARSYTNCMPFFSMVSTCHVCKQKTKLGFCAWSAVLRHAWCDERMH